MQNTWTAVWNSERKSLRHREVETPWDMLSFVIVSSWCESCRGCSCVIVESCRVVSDNRLPAKSTPCSGSLHLSIEIGSSRHACRLHLAFKTLMWAKRLFAGESRPLVDALGLILSTFGIAAVFSNEVVLLAVFSFAICCVALYRALWCAELYVVTLSQSSSAVLCLAMLWSRTMKIL